MKSLLTSLVHRHLFTNMLFIGVLGAGFLFWQWTPKEELPEMSLDFVMVSVAYPGASPQEVERLVTWPIEKELRGLSGIDSMESLSGEGTSRITIELIRDHPNRDQVVTDIRNRVLSVSLPSEIYDTPEIREFETSEKPVIDINFYLEGQRFLSVPQRQKLQQFVHTFENNLLAHPTISDINKKNYLTEEIHIQLLPNKLAQYQLSAHQVMAEIRKAIIRQPAGKLESYSQETVIFRGEPAQIDEFARLPIQGSFAGGVVLLRDIARIFPAFEKSTSIKKVNGHEAVMAKIVKSTSAGILDTVDFIQNELAKIQPQAARQGIHIVALDDESRDVRNRLNIIADNGLLGFAIILVLLFLFLNIYSGFWVAVGIPFTFAFTLILGHIFDYSINNITLASVIIVMGMVVDDAIVISENITRLRAQGVERARAAVEGTAYMLLPITASTLTTIVAFAPLYAFEGRFAMMANSIPAIVALMLVGSLVEALIILPGHLNLATPSWLRNVYSLGLMRLISKVSKPQAKKEKKIKKQKDRPSHHWFDNLEKGFAVFIERLLPYRIWVVLLFSAFVVGGIFLGKDMRFVLFPREETTQIIISAQAPAGTPLKRSAELARNLEKVFEPYLGREVVGFRTNIGMRRHSNSAEQNQIFMRVELLPLDKRGKPLRLLRQEWQKKFAKIDSLSDIKFARRRFGSDSGSPIKIMVQNSDYPKLVEASRLLQKELKNTQALKNIELGEKKEIPSYELIPNRIMARRLAVDVDNISQTLRTTLDGVVVARLLKGDEETAVRVTLADADKENIDQVLNIPVINKNGYLVPLRRLVSVNKIHDPSQIRRKHGQRVRYVYADLRQGYTPLQAADILEKDVFAKIAPQIQGTNFLFDGEIKNTRESSGFFVVALMAALLLIFIILAVLFNSLYLPFFVLAAVPPSIISVIYTYWLHGMSQYGFFGVIGAVGLIGVVVNDDIILIKKLEDNQWARQKQKRFKEIAQVVASRFKAVLLTSLTTVAGLFPTAYGILGYDSMLAEMMLAISWGLIFGTTITLIFLPAIYSYGKDLSQYFRQLLQNGDPS